MMRKLAIIILLSLIAAPALAVLPDEVLEDPALEARAREVSKELRCVVCQNQTIDDSNAPLAHDMRMLVRERILSGDTNEEAKGYLVARYGDFVLMRPPIKPKTWFLWLGPFLFLAAAIGSFGLYWRTAKGARLETPAPLSKAEAQALTAEMREEND